MFLGVDIGNSNITVGGFDGSSWSEHRFTSDSHQSVEHYEDHFKALKNDISFDVIEGIAVSSVVPSLTKKVLDALEYAFNMKPLLLDKKSYSSLPIIPLNPDEIGTDLVANALAGWERFNNSFLVVDFGTALTYTYVDTKGEITGVSIAPGIETAMNTLANNAAQLPEVNLDLPVNSLGKNTVEAIKAGIMWGFVGQVQFMVDKIRSQYHPNYVIATGGLSEVLDPLRTTFDGIDKHLTLKGLRQFYEIVSGE